MKRLQYRLAPGYRVAPAYKVAPVCRVAPVGAASAANATAARTGVAFAAEAAPTGGHLLSSGSPAKQLVALLALFILTACQPTPREAPEDDAILDRGLAADLETLDPQRARSVAAAKVLGDLYEPLLVLDAAGRVQPGAASHWEVSPDGLTYRFFLRENGRWSNGDPVVAADFVRGMQTLVAPDTAAFYAANLTAVKNAAQIAAAKASPETLGAEATSSGVLKLTLERPAPQLLAMLSHASAAPRHTDDAAGAEAGPAAKMLHSNGPYRLSERIFGGSIELELNPFHRDAERIAIGRVRYVPLEDEMAEYHRFGAGGLDVTSRVPARMLGQVNPDELHVAPYLGVYYLAFNMKLPPTHGSELLRRALSLSIDRELITKTITGRGETPAWSFVPPAIDGYTPAGAQHMDENTGWRLNYARELYRKSGFSPENPLELQLRYNSSEENRRIAVALQAMWREALGFELELVQQEFRVLLSETRGGQEPGLVRGSWIADFADPINFLAIFGSTHSSNPAGYSNPAYDELLAAANRETDSRRRAAVMREAETLLMADQPVIPIFFYVSKHLVNTRITGWQDNPLDYHYSRHLGFAEVSE